MAKRLRERSTDYPSVCDNAADTSPDKGRLLFAPLFCLTTADFSHD
ncbi:MAG: hypothetical protein IKY44_04450 [Clostridia bacterium]|nr:hypothetical protein [Clostridia bacterium]